MSFPNLLASPAAGARLAGAPGECLEGGAWLAAGSGGLLVAWLPAGTRAAFLSEARAVELRPVSCRLDLRGAAGPDA